MCSLRAVLPAAAGLIRAFCIIRPRSWVSDNTDAYDRLKIQYATSLAYPLSCLSNHISEVPNHQTGRIMDPSFRRDVALFGIFGYELNLLKDHGLRAERMKEIIRQYKIMEPAVLHGDFYHLQSPFASNEPAVALAWQDDVFVGLYQIQSDLKGEILPAQKLPFVQEGCWSVQKEQQVLPASVLRLYGVRKPLRNNGANQGQAAWIGDYQSCIVHLKRES